jgi:hypothetical protein
VVVAEAAGLLGNGDAPPAAAEADTEGEAVVAAAVGVAAADEEAVSELVGVTEMDVVGAGVCDGESELEGVAESEEETVAAAVPLALMPRLRVAVAEAEDVTVAAAVREPVPLQLADTLAVAVGEGEVQGTTRVAS